MDQNMGKMNRFLRLTAGFYLLGVGINRQSNLLMVAGSMKIATGLTKWCPIVHILEKKAQHKEAANKENPHELDKTQVPVT
ncbi:MAG: DUF2892 domain-containing protein [Clostridiales bacterium]|nr:DUF2892 domain-containing protein [Clostridiales bacterium]